MRKFSRKFFCSECKKEVNTNDKKRKTCCGKCSEKRAKKYQIEYQKRYRKEHKFITKE